MKRIAIVMAAIVAAAILPGVARAYEMCVDAACPNRKAEDTLLGGFESLQKDLQERLASYDAYRVLHGEVIQRLLALGFVMESPALDMFKGNPKQTHRLYYAQDGRTVLYVTIQGALPSSHLRGEGHIMYRATLQGESIQREKSFISLEDFSVLTNNLGDIAKIIRRETAALKWIHN